MTGRTNEGNDRPEAHRLRSALVAAISLALSSAPPPRRCWPTSTGGRSSPTGARPASSALPTATATRSPTTAPMRRELRHHSGRHTSGRRRVPQHQQAGAGRWIRPSTGGSPIAEPGQDQPVARAQRLHQQRVRFRRSQPFDAVHHDGDRLRPVLGVRREQRPAKEPAQLSRTRGRATRSWKAPGAASPPVACGRCSRAARPTST